MIPFSTIRYPTYLNDFDGEESYWTQSAAGRELAQDEKHTIKMHSIGIGIQMEILV